MENKFFNSSQEEDAFLNCSFNPVSGNFIPIEEQLDNLLYPNNPQPKKKSELDDIFNSIEREFNETSQIEEYSNIQIEENSLKIDQTGIDLIQEDNEQDGPNSSFVHENKDLIQNIGNAIEPYENHNMTMPLANVKNDSLQDELDLQKIKMNFMSIKLSKTLNTTNKNINKSAMSINKHLFTISNTSASTLNNDLFNTSIKLNLNSSSNINQSNVHKPKRGRKKLLLEGIKTEVIDKAYIREFKKYLKANDSLLRPYYEEDSLFWNEFFQNTIPFTFTQPNGEKIEYKSYSQSLLKMIFSKELVHQLYSHFIKEKEKELLSCIMAKRITKADNKMLMFYKFYGQNFHKIYSDKYDFNDFTWDDYESNSFQLN